ncbi:MAG TPA: ribonuclease P protein component [Actinomycetota bacterium]|nr:ribonuclease P protein component [Actinomycetota bacterium]
MLRSGKGLRSDRVIVFVAPGEGPCRGAWVAGRRVGPAVVRNRARRLLRQAWWELWPRIDDGHDVVLVARSSLEGAGAPEVTEEIEGLLHRAGVMRR